MYYLITPAKLYTESYLCPISKAICFLDKFSLNESMRVKTSLTLDKIIEDKTTSGLYMAAWCRGSTNNRISMIYTHWEVGMFFLPTLLIPTGHSSDRSPLVCCFTTLRQTGWEVTTYLSCIISICQAMPSLLEGVSVYLMYNFIHLQTCNWAEQHGVESLGKSE